MTEPIRAIVTDIEGTTTAVSFVYETLFPYAKKHLPAFVRAHAADPAIAALLKEAALEGKLDDPEIEKVIALLDEWMTLDKKAGSLKTLQGMVWEKGFHQGDFKGHVYEDAYRNLIKWHAQNIPLYIYSSGSVQAQKLLFSCSTFGDLTFLFSGYFDTAIGGKKEAASYFKIVEEIGQPAKTILFLSDVVEELDAAKEAGMQTRLVCRSASRPLKNEHKIITTFDEQ